MGTSGGSSIARKYARAFFDLAKEEKRLQRGLKDLILIDEALVKKSGGLGEGLSFFCSPIIDHKSKIQVLAQLSGANISAEVLTFVSFLVTKGRMAELSSIVQEIRNLIDEEEGILRGQLVSAFPLERERVQQIETYISHRLDKKVILDLGEDLELLGGLIVQVGGWTFDDSLKSHLIRLGEDLRRESAVGT